MPAEVELLVYERPPPRLSDKKLFDLWYEQYRASPVWAAKRGAVLRRAFHQCCQCRRAPAREVHHLTYVRVGRELLRDLRAVCRPCHERIHGVQSRFDLMVTTFDVDDLDAEVDDIDDVEDLLGFSPGETSCTS